MIELVRGSIIVVIVALVALLFMRRNKDNHNIYNIIGMICFAIIIMSIFIITGISPTSGFYRFHISGDVSLIPFDDIYNLISDCQEDYSMSFLFLNLLGNVILFIPFGIILPVLWKENRKFATTFFRGMALSFCIEIMQLFLIRATSIDDIILNSLGTAIGYVIFKLAYLLMPKFCDKFISNDSYYKCEGLIFIIIVLVVQIALGFYDIYVYMNY